VLEQAGVEQLEQVRPGGLVRRVQQRASRGHEVEVPLHLNHTMLEHTLKKKNASTRACFFDRENGKLLSALTYFRQREAF
jgi:hypothetical protein